ncbi:LacI family DNA-binding transcriptional regulator [Variovorax sp. OV329]|uniref:LacI family DNA-binding transcriptional regulator n=1 Tax=Variovorax sp. OV329 TaxID=1882825 RepID=UPI0008F08DB1|nr:LacI family DNA-binding transcriptional regulator [Variovorax sp. OV329]SFN36433.1 LacI family transcriptional regulator [Variovorax sp. OV329]
MSSAPTIADIARKAGVGTATVDRVLNRRAGVNAETVQRVQQVVEELGAPQQQPGRPRKSANARFAFVLPAEETPFFGLVERQIAQAASDFRHGHITEVTHRIDTSDPARFAEQLAEVGDCEGIALLAPDLPPIKRAVNELVRAGVHVVTLFSDVAGSMRETCIGADNRAAGRTAGLLLGRMAGQEKHRDVLLLSSQATRLSSEIERRIGFAQVLEERFPEIRMHRTADLPPDDEGACEALLQVLRDDVEPARVAGIYNVGSGSEGVARALAQAGLTASAGMVAHDFTDAHASLLGANHLSYVLHQDIHYCVLTAARVLRALCENVRGALNVVQPRIEILTAENLH